MTSNAIEKAGQTPMEELAAMFDSRQFKMLHEEITFDEYLNRCFKNPRLIRTAYQRIYDMVMAAGCSKFQKYRKTYTHYNFFDHKDTPIFGLEKPLNELVRFLQSAASGYGTDRRVLLLHGPVGSSKSTICRALKRGMERYSNTDEGAWYSFKWVEIPTGQEGIYTHKEDECPMHEEPLKLIPPEIRGNIIKKLNEILIANTKESERNNLYTLRVDGELDPRCKKFMEELLKRNGGDWKAVIDKHIHVVRKVYSETDRIGIATFQPKDEKNQDSTELTGDINFAKLTNFGSDSDPRAFNFDGEFCVGNRGTVEFIEMLKLAKEFLYDLLGASQEKNIKPKKFAQISVDLALIGHTNAQEFLKLVGDPTMEALRDRTFKIDIPYLLEWSKEVQVLLQDYNTTKVKQHIAPHTLEIAALWAILTRLKDDKDKNLDLVQKAELYDGKALPNWTEDSIKELRDKYPEEGIGASGQPAGVSCRYVQDKISNCLASHHDYINPFMALNEIREGLSNSPLIGTSKNDIDRYMLCVDLAEKKLADILKAEVQKALSGDEAAITRLCANYIDNLMAHIQKSKVTNPYTGKEQEPDERLMRSIEEKIDIPEQGSDDFRRSIASFIGALANQKKMFRWDSNPKLQKAFEAKMFEDTKDHVKLSSFSKHGMTVADKDIQAKIDAVKDRMVKQFGYTDQSATDVLNYVSSIFARGDAVKED